MDTCIKLSEIKKNAPEGATHYRVMNNLGILYFNDNHQYWNWHSKIWVDTLVKYQSEEVKPL